MPRAIPEAPTIPSSPNPAEISWASRLPLAEALRAPHDRDDRRGEEFWLAEQCQDWRRVLDGFERFGVKRLTPAHNAGADAVECRQFALGVGAARHRDITPAKLRYRFERRVSRAKAAQQRIKSDGADRLGARQTQPVEAFLRVELARRLAPVQSASLSSSSARRGSRSRR
jgi:hypothetical protein